MKPFSNGHVRRSGVGSRSYAPVVVRKPVPIRPVLKEEKIVIPDSPPLLPLPRPVVTRQLGALTKMAQEIMAEHAQVEVTRKEAIQRRKDYVRSVNEWVAEVMMGICEVEMVVGLEGMDDAAIDVLFAKPSLWPRNDGKQYTIGEQYTEWQEGINEYKNDPDPAISLRVTGTETLSRLASLEFDFPGLQAYVATLVESNVLVRVGNGSIRLAGENYSLTPRFDGLDPEDSMRLSQGIKTAVGDQVTRIRREEEQVMQAQVRAFADASTMSLADFFTGDLESGTCSFITKDGGILVKIDGDNVTMLRAYGRHENAFLRIKELQDRLGVTLVISRSALKNERGQLRHQSKITNPVIPPGLSSDDDKTEWVNLGRFVTHGCREGLLAAKILSKELIEKSSGPRQVMREQPLNPEQFHKEKALGCYKVVPEQWYWRFKTDTGKVSDEETLMTGLELVVERFANADGSPRLRLLECSPQWEQLLISIGCFKSEGYLEDRLNKYCRFLEKILRVDYALNFLNKD